MDEVWKPVVGWEELYEVSSYGRLRSRSKMMVGEKHKSGYIRATLSRNGTRERVFIHVLVLTAFVGPRPDGLVTRHLDGNRTNNNISNIVWGTQKENCEDSFRHETFRYGEQRVDAKLKTADVIELREAHARGASLDSLARKYGIAYNTANRIATGKMWKQAGGPIRPMKARYWYLTEENVREIRAACANGGESLRSIGRRFGVPGTSIRAIRDQKAYKWVD